MSSPSWTCTAPGGTAVVCAPLVAGTAIAAVVADLAGAPSALVGVLAVSAAAAAVFNAANGALDYVLLVLSGAALAAFFWMPASAPAF